MGWVASMVAFAEAIDAGAPDARIRSWEVLLVAFTGGRASSRTRIVRAALQGIAL